METLNNPFTAIFEKLIEIESKISNNKNFIKSELAEELLNVDAAAQLLLMPVSTVRYHQRNNSLPYLKVGKRNLYRKNEILSWLNEFNLQYQRKNVFHGMMENRITHTKK